MKSIEPILLFILVTLLVIIDSSVSAQINYIKENGSVRIIANSVLLPNTTVTSNSVISDNPNSQPILLDEFINKCGGTPFDSISALNQPHYGNNQFLIDLVDSIENTGGTYYRTSTVAEIFEIPVRAWKYRKNDPSFISLPDDVVEAYINHANNFFIQNGLNFFLYLKCQPTEVTSDFWTTGVVESNLDTFFDQNWETGVLNIHFVRNADANWGRFPFKTNKPYCALIITSQFFEAERGNVLSHEVGHSFGLYHTHENARRGGDNGTATDCFQEYVSRTMYNNGCFSTNGKKKCEVNGDLLCDTDADPNIDRRAILPGCAYNRTGLGNDYLFDNSSQPWLTSGYDNALRNVMSYSLRTCRTELKRSQRGVMYNYMLRYTTPWQYIPPGTVIIGQKQKNSVNFYTNNELDAFENDNFWNPGLQATSAGFYRQFNNQFTFNTIQTHSLHKSPQNASSSCDKDFVWFTISSSREVQIETSIVSGKTTADTELFLYAINTATGALSLLVSDDNSAGNGFSSIISTLPIGDYAVEVRGKSQTIASYYNLRIGDNCYNFLNGSYPITGPTSICTSGGTFSITNLPGGSVSTWQVSPSGSFTSGSGSGSAVTLYPVNNNPVSATITFSVISGSCGPLQKSYSFNAGSPQFSISRVDNVPYSGTPVFLCPGNHWLETTPINSTGSISWQVPSGVPYAVSGGGTYVDFTLYSNSSGFVITATASNSCGSNNFNFYIQKQTYGCSGYYSLSVYPNPTNDELNVELIPVDESLESKTKAKETFIDEIILYDKNMTSLLRKDKFQSKGVIDVKQIPKGIYVLYVRIGKEIIQKQILVDR